MFWETIRIALYSLRSHKVRTLLTILSVMIGAFSIVVMMSLAESGSMTLARSVEEIGGARLVWWVPDNVREARDRNLYSKGITRQDADALRSLPFVNQTTGFATWNQQTTYYSTDNAQKVDVVGILDGLLDGLTWPTRLGRPFNESEMRNFARVCLLSSELSDKLFGEAGPLGKRINVVGKPYKVVGVLKPRKMLMNVSLGFEWENSVFIPLSTGEKREGLTTASLVLVAFTKDPRHNKDVVGLGNAKLLARHNGVADFQSINFGEIMGSFNQFFQVTSLIVGFIAAVSLFAGGIGVMNIMLVTVTERTREIGIRKALGASIPTILFQFLGEAVVLSGLGGMLGALIGVGTVFLANIGLTHWSEFWVEHYSTLGIGMALFVTSSIGLFFGAWPAFQAARLDIVECLRR